MLELDELWSFVLPAQEQALGLAGPVPPDPPDRRLRHRRARRGRLPPAVLGERVPPEYKAGLLYTDFWAAYAQVLPPEQHRATGKGEGQTCHIERFNNVLRQRLGRFVRRTLSFSKSDVMHDNCLRLFLHQHNQPTRHQPKRLRLI